MIDIKITNLKNIDDAVETDYENAVEEAIKVPISNVTLSENRVLNTVNNSVSNDVTDTIADLFSKCPANTTDALDTSGLDPNSDSAILDAASAMVSAADISKIDCDTLASAVTAVTTSDSTAKDGASDIISGLDGGDAASTGGETATHTINDYIKNTASDTSLDNLISLYNTEFGSDVYIDFSTFKSSNLYTTVVNGIENYITANGLTDIDNAESIDNYALDIFNIIIDNKRHPTGITIAADDTATSSDAVANSIQDTIADTITTSTYASAISLPDPDYDTVLDVAANRMETNPSYQDQISGDLYNAVDQSDMGVDGITVLNQASIVYQDGVPNSPSSILADAADTAGSSYLSNYVNNVPVVAAGNSTTPATDMAIDNNIVINAINDTYTPETAAAAIDTYNNNTIINSIPGSDIAAAATAANGGLENADTGFNGNLTNNITDTSDQTSVYSAIAAGSY